jgi:hypothetical protein
VFYKIKFIETNDGYNFSAPEKTVITVFIENNSVKKKTQKVEKIAAVKEICITEFDSDLTEEEKSFYFDLNNDGKDETFSCVTWARWGTLNIDLAFGEEGEPIKFQGKRLGILSSMTAGMHDIVIDLNDVYKWDGETYKRVE